MESVITKQSFTIEYTNYAKGIAIILLLIHHFVFTPYHVPYTSGSIRELVVLLGKVCVPLFCVLSGYGITKSYNKYSLKSDSKDGQFVFYHLKKLLINYWWVYIPTLIAALTIGFRGYPWEVYGKGFKAFIYFFLDFSGMRAIAYTPTYCNTWWFIEATIVFYALFPLIYKAYKKLPITTMIVLFIPLIYNIFFKVPDFLKNTTDREIYYLSSFAIGMLLADKGILDKAIKLCSDKKSLYCIISSVFVLVGAAAAVFIPLFGMLCFALSIIGFVVFMKSIKLNFAKIFEFFGKYSMNVFLIHSLYMSYVKNYIRFDSLGIFNYILQFIIIFVSSFAISFSLEYIKKFVRTKIIHKNKIPA